MPKIKTKAKITADSKPDYQPTQPPGYFYMFTGGYRVDSNGKPVKVPGDDDGPAGNVAFGEESGSWEINLVDTTGEKFKIVKWTVTDNHQLGLSFDPPPGTELSPTGKLTIEVDDIPTGHENEFEKFSITVENENGVRVELDPRLYDIR